MANIKQWPNKPFIYAELHLTADSKDELEAKVAVELDIAKDRDLSCSYSPLMPVGGSPAGRIQLGATSLKDVPDSVPAGYRVFTVGKYIEVEQAKSMYENANRTNE